MENRDSTIAALSTPRLKGGIAMIRVSGQEALNVASGVFKPKSKKCAVCDMEGYSAAYGAFEIDGKTVDDGVVIVYREPKSYTGENVAELCCHGGVAVADMILKECIANGAVAAQAGEFTKRAYLNGKMDLTQAEAVNELINARSEEYVKAVSLVKSGGLYREIDAVLSGLIKLEASVAAVLEYPEEDGADIDRTALYNELKTAKTRLLKLVERSRAGRILNEGIRAVLIGRPNVGKSTLMNLISQKHKSIVTDVAGTTRDLIEERVEIEGLPFILTDTAGLREDGGEIERIGISRAKSALDECDIAIGVLDASASYNEDDTDTLKAVKPHKAIIVLNKTDKDARQNRDYLTGFDVVRTSKYDEKTIDDLKTQMVKTADVDKSCLNLPSFIGARQLGAANSALKQLNMILNDPVLPLDVLSVYTERAIEFLSDLTGETASDRVIDEVFSEFCIGK